jgi:hypothetical protein
LKLEKLISYAFCNAWSLREITFPPNVKIIGEFNNCTNLVSLDFSDCHQLRKFERFAFNHASSLENVIFPPNVRIIGGFGVCKKLVYCNFSNCLQLEKIYANAFEFNIALRDIQFPQNLKIIESGAFRKCTNLTTIKIPASVEIIGENSFKSCAKLEEVTFEGPTMLATGAFENCARLVRRIYLQTRFVDCVYGKYCDLQESLLFEKVECGISLEEFKDDSNIVILRCGHAFLEESFHEWTKKQRICPACKQRI